MNLELDDTRIAVRLSPFEKVAGITRDVVIPLADVREASVDPTPMQSIRGRILMGLRIPRRYYIARTLGRPEFWALTDAGPALRLITRDGRRVTASAPDAAGVAQRIADRASSTGSSPPLT